MRYNTVIAEVLGETKEEPLFLLGNIREDFIKGMIFDLLFERQKKGLPDWELGDGHFRKKITSCKGI